MDVMYLVREREENEPLRYSLRTLWQNFPHDTVWIAGHLPSWLQNVRHIPTEQGRRSKYQNNRLGMLSTCEHDEVSDPFLYMNDDFFILEPLRDVPYLYRATIEEHIRVTLKKHDRGRQANISPHRQGGMEAMNLLQSYGIRNPLSYEVHMPMKIEKDKMAKVLHETEDMHTPSFMRSLYGNLCDVGGARVDDVKPLTGTRKATYGPFLSTNQRSWHGYAGNMVRERFQEPSPYEGDTE